ncbi:hypothetical protein CROQUDRAFT_660031, partial [Cronartium quercuum f. sp. fusiforme G11]
MESTQDPTDGSASTTNPVPVIPAQVLLSSPTQTKTTSNTEPEHTSSISVDQTTEPIQAHQPTLSTTDTSPSTLPTNPQPENLLPKSVSEPSNELTNLSPEVRELAVMFPQIQPSILEAVLAAHHNQAAECVSDLLAMSDPTWKPTAEDIVTSDEALARQLAREEGIQPQQPTLPQMNVPYQPRIRRNPSTRSPPSSYDPSPLSPNTAGTSLISPSGKDEIQKIADEFSKIAETGKKTVSMWLNKAKAKIQEMQQPQSNDGRSDEPMNEYDITASHPASERVANGSEYGSSLSTTTRSNRISPALPYSSRYDSSAPTKKSETPAAVTNTSTVRQSIPAVGGYHVEEPLHENRIPAVGGTSGGKSIPSPGPNRTRDDDEESLEYTRNPFEDD